MMRHWLTLAVLALPSAALACPVCGQADARSQGAYIAMTAVLTFLPLIVMGVLVALFLRRLKRSEATQELLRMSAPLPPRPRAIDERPEGPEGRQLTSHDVAGLPTLAVSRDKVPQQRLDA